MSKMCINCSIPNCTLNLPRGVICRLYVPIQGDHAQPPHVRAADRAGVVVVKNGKTKQGANDGGRYK